MKLRGTASWLPNHLDRVCRLGACARSHARTAPAALGADVTGSTTSSAAAPRRLRWAVEVRSDLAARRDVYATLERHGAALCIHDLLERHPWMRTTDWTYVRFHGPNAPTEQYVGRYGGRRLWRAAERLAEWAETGVDAYVYFNNDFGGAAVEG